MNRAQRRAQRKNAGRSDEGRVVFTLSYDPATGRECMTHTVLQPGETYRSAMDRNMAQAEAHLDEWAAA